MIHELQVAFDEIRSKLELAPRQGVSAHRLTAENRCNFEFTGYGCSAVGVD